MNTAGTKRRFYLALVIFSLVGQVAWVVENMYLNVFIYKMFHATAEQISLMVAASAVTATVTTLLIGALSDKLGKRKVFICGGYILWGLSILGFALIREVYREVNRKHIFTHIEWDMRGVYLEVENEHPGYVWMTPEEIEAQAALPTAFRQFFQEVHHV